MGFFEASVHIHDLFDLELRVGFLQESNRIARGHGSRDSDGSFSGVGRHRTQKTTQATASCHN